MTLQTTAPATFIGLMSGTSLDGVDGVMVTFDRCSPRLHLTTSAKSYIPFPPELKQELMALQSTGDDEINREATVANKLVGYYANCVDALLSASSLPAGAITAIGVHGQTIRHRPELGYTRQTNNPALLAELTGIDVIADLRSRDLAAGGQGAPLVPAFHDAVFLSDAMCRVVANIGGISNISVLRPGGQNIIGFDTGPGNVLMDLWTQLHHAKPFDANGAWAASGTLDHDLLATLAGESFFGLPFPKSTGRDLFNMEWLEQRLAKHPGVAACDVQRTLCELTALSLVDAIATAGNEAEAVFICGGGAANSLLMNRIQAQLAGRGMTATVASTDVLGIAPDAVEATAFAWLAYRFTERQPGNLPTVTGARGTRILGALYPA